MHCMQSARVRSRAAPCVTRPCAPVHLALAAAQAGRNDLRYALQLHSHLKLAEALGVAPSSRGGYHKTTNHEQEHTKQ